MEEEVEAEDHDPVNPPDRLDVECDQSTSTLMASTYPELRKFLRRPFPPPEGDKWDPPLMPFLADLPSSVNVKQEEPLSLESEIEAFSQFQFPSIADPEVGVRVSDSGPSNNHSSVKSEGEVQMDFTVEEPEEWGFPGVPVLEVIKSVKIEQCNPVPGSSRVQVPGSDDDEWGEEVDNNEQDSDYNPVDNEMDSDNSISDYNPVEDDEQDSDGNTETTKKITRKARNRNYTPTVTTNGNELHEDTSYSANKDALNLQSSSTETNGIRKHNNEGPIPCQFCKRFFKRRSGYTLHLKIKHGHIPEPKQRAEIPNDPPVENAENPFESEKVRSAFCNIWKDLVNRQKTVPVEVEDHQSDSSDSIQFIESMEKSAVVHEEVCISSDSEMDEDCRPDNIGNGATQTLLSLTEVKQEPQSDLGRVFKCHQCDNSSYHKKSELLRHIREMHLSKKEINMFDCTECGYQAGCQLRLDLHILSQHLDLKEQIKPYKCNECKTKTLFSSIDRLNLHMKNFHKQENPFRCKFCGDMFIRRSYLTRHLRIHTKERPYQCSACDRTFYRRDNLTTHIKRIHPEGANVRRLQCKNENEITLLTWIQCSVCKVFLKNPELMLAHLKKFHDFNSENGVVQYNARLSRKSQSNNEGMDPMDMDIDSEGQNLSSAPGTCTKIVLTECAVNLSRSSDAMQLFLDKEKLKSNLKSKFLSIFTSVSQDDSEGIPRIIKTVGSSANLTPSVNVRNKPKELNLSDFEYVTDDEGLSSDSSNNDHRSKKYNSCKSYESGNRSSDEEVHLDEPPSPLDVHRSSSSDIEDEILYEATVLSSLSTSCSCEICGKTFSNGTVFKRHVRFHETDDSLTCCVCNIVQPTKEELLKHYKDHNQTSTTAKNTNQTETQDTSANPTYACHKCNLTFSKQIGLKIHLKIHQTEQPKNRKTNNDTASKPKVTVVNSSKSSTKEMSPTIEDGLPCLLCNLKFSSSNDLIQHYRVHQNQKTTSSSALQSHDHSPKSTNGPSPVLTSGKHTHSSLPGVEQPPIPPESELCFKFKIAKDKVINPKSNETNTTNGKVESEHSSFLFPFTCPKCDKRFRLIYNRDKHLRCQHPDLNDKSSDKVSETEINSLNEEIRIPKSLEITYTRNSDGYYPCLFPKCGKKFLSTKVFRQHVHNRFPYRCPTCDKGFAKIKYESHIKICNPQKLRKEEEDTAQYIRSIVSKSKPSSQTRMDETRTPNAIDMANDDDHNSSSHTRRRSRRRPLSSTDSKSLNNVEDSSQEIDNQHSCPHCALKFSDQSDLHTHMATHAFISYCCGICGKICPDREELLKHISVNHPKTTVSEQSSILGI